MNVRTDNTMAIILVAVLLLVVVGYYIERRQHTEAQFRADMLLQQQRMEARIAAADQAQIELDKKRMAAAHPTP